MLALPGPPVVQVAGEVVSMVVPCADMANHLNDPNAAYVYNPRTDCFELVSLRVRVHTWLG